MPNRNVGHVLIQTRRVDRHMSSMDWEHPLAPHFLCPAEGCMAWLLDDRKPVKFIYNEVLIMCPSMKSFLNLRIESREPMTASFVTVYEYKRWMDDLTPEDRNDIRMVIGVKTTVDTSFHEQTTKRFPMTFCASGTRSW